MVLGVKLVRNVRSECSESNVRFEKRTGCVDCGVYEVRSEGNEWSEWSVGSGD